jgi:hypothetical protein
MAYLKITITDTMSFWDNYIEDYIFNPENSKTFSGWYRVPDEWVHKGALPPERREKILEYMYGATWRSGNDDGSKYVVLKMEEHKLTDTEIAERPWFATHESCYSVSPDGTVERIEAVQM